MVETVPETATHKNSGLAGALLCGLLAAVFVFLYHARYSKSNYLISDSADYVRAAHSPFLRTYLNTDSASPVQLFEMRHDPAFRAHPWDYLYFHDDNAAIRHFHSPLSFYPMHVVSLFTSADSHQRAVSSLVTAVTCGAVVIGLATFGVPLAAAGLMAVVVGIQSRYTEVSVEPSPHGWYMLFALLFLFTFATYLKTRQLRALAISAVLLGCAFATLEFSLELIASIPLALAFQWLLDRRALGDLKILVISFAKSFPIFLGVTFVLWPGGWIRGGYLESYGVTGSTVLFKNKAEFGSHITAVDLYRKFFGGHEALLLLIAFAVFALIALVIRRRLSTVTIVFMSYTIVAFALGIADHFRLNTYISEALLFLLVTVALLFQDLLTAGMAGRRQVALSMAVLVLLIAAVQEWLRRPSTAIYQPWLKPVLIGVSTNVPPGATILVNGNWEEYYAYLPKYNFEPTVSVTDLSPRNSQRAQSIRFFLLSNDAPEIPNTKLLDSFHTGVAGQSIDLYKEE